MQYKAVLFDFDYTLGDSTLPITLGYQAGLTAMGWPKPTMEQVRPTIGMTLQNGYTLLTGDADEARRDEFFARFQDAVGARAVERGDRTMVEKSLLFPGTVELLSALKAQGIPTGIVSTKTGAIIRDIFELRGLSHLLDLIVGGEHVTRAKPDPQGLLGAIDRLGLTPADVLFCGDTVIDAKTAQAAGTHFCAVLNGTTPASAFADYPHRHVAPDLAELKLWLGL